jgi:hypothetical protein
MQKLFSSLNITASHGLDQEPWCDGIEEQPQIANVIAENLAVENKIRQLVMIILILVLTPCGGLCTRL